jgi:hypothetical protein
MSNISVLVRCVNKFGPEGVGYFWLVRQKSVVLEDLTPQEKLSLLQKYKKNKFYTSYNTAHRDISTMFVNVGK